MNMVKHMITKKETEADKHIRENLRPDSIKEKTMPDPYEIPAVEDYVVDKPTIPKEEE